MTEGLKKVLRLVERPDIYLLISDKLSTKRGKKRRKKEKKDKNEENKRKKKIFMCYVAEKDMKINGVSG